MLRRNAWHRTNPSLPAGVTIDAQRHGRDSGFAPPGNVPLGNGLELTLLP